MSQSGQHPSTKSAEIPVTVFMPVYNAEKFLSAAIKSILNQTFQNFEFLIIDDGSTDSSPAIVNSFSDPRIRFISYRDNLGLGTVRNLGITEARGNLLTLMDADDISLPNRLTLQVNYLLEHPHVDAVGTWLERFNDTRARSIKTPTTFEVIRATMLFHNSICHATLMMRRQRLIEHELKYPVDFQTAEDFDFCSRLVERLQISTLPQISYRWRTVLSSASTVNSGHIESAFRKRIYRHMLERLGFQVTPDILTQHDNIANFYEIHAITIQSVYDWFCQIWQKNTAHRIYPSYTLGNILGEQLYFHCIKRDLLTRSSALRIFQNSIFSDYYRPPLRSLVRVRAEAFLRKV